MTRDEFTKGVTERLRNVLQKHDRERSARIGVNDAGGTGWLPRADAALRVANTNLDAAITELADFVFDATANQSEVSR